jgi:hypothetical protein
MKNILLTIITLVALASPIAAQAQDMKVQKVTNSPKNCFALSKNKIFVPYNLTKAQKKTLTMIKASSLVIDNLKLGWSLENDIVACEKSGKIISGFTKKVNPTLVAYPSLTTYTADKKYFELLNGKESKVYHADVKVGVGYSPQTGYKATAEINPIN